MEQKTGYSITETGLLEARNFCSGVYLGYCCRQHTTWQQHAQGLIFYLTCPDVLSLVRNLILG